MGMPISEWLKKNPKMNQALGQIMLPGEVISVLIEGAFKQLVIGTDRRIIVYKKGLRAGATLGSKVTSWEYKNITGIQLDSRMGSGTLMIRAAGEEAVKASYWANGKGSAQEAPNAIVFAAKPGNDIHQLVARLNQFVADAHAGVQQPPPSIDSPMEQLKQLGELHEAGVLTTDEFDRKKQELLSRI